MQVPQGKVGAAHLAGCGSTSSMERRCAGARTCAMLPWVLNTIRSASLAVSSSTGGSAPAARLGAGSDAAAAAPLLACVRPLTV